MPALSLHVLVVLVKNGFLHLHAELSEKALWTGFEPQCVLSGLYGLLMYACMHAWSTNLRNQLFLKQDQFSSTIKGRTGQSM